MRVVTLVVGGLADTAPPDGGKTALEAANLPTLDALASEGILGLTRMVPAGSFATTTATLLAALGYDPVACPLSPGRAVALGLGADVGDRQVGVLDLVTAGVDEAGREIVSGVGGSYLMRADRRALLQAVGDMLVQRGVQSWIGTQAAVEIGPGRFVERGGPPWKAIGSALVGDDADAELRRACRATIENAPVVTARRSGGAPVPTDVWVWGGGNPLVVPHAFPESGIVLADDPVPLGVARFVGLDSAPLNAPEDEAAWSGTLPTILGAMEQHALTLVYVDTIDALGHRGDAAGKVGAIEALDRELLGPLCDALRSHGGDWRVAVLSGHVTSTTTRAHADDAVPFVVYASRPEHRSRHARRRFHERDAREQGIFTPDGHELVSRLLRR